MRSITAIRFNRKKIKRLKLPEDVSLYFERFLNPARVDPPDVDVDFAWDERDELIQKVIERFGPGRCARVANHNTFRSRSAFQETAKAYGFGDGEISRIEKQLFYFADALAGC
jgi:DNA polymerase-3 subunit alpha/error-prone DNA polymerase